MISGESSVPGFQMAIFLLCPHMTFPLYTRGERDRQTDRQRQRSGVSSFSYEDTSPIDQGPTHMTLFNFFYLLKGPHFEIQPH